MKRFGRSKFLFCFPNFSSDVVNDFRIFLNNVSRLSSCSADSIFLLFFLFFTKKHRWPPHLKCLPVPRLPKSTFLQKTTTKQFSFRIEKTKKKFHITLGRGDKYSQGAGVCLLLSCNIWKSRKQTPSPELFPLEFDNIKIDKKVVY